MCVPVSCTLFELEFVQSVKFFLGFSSCIYFLVPFRFMVYNEKGTRGGAS